MIRDTKQEILTTAWRMMAEKGFSGTSLSNICAEVGIAKPTLLHHYSSKEKLYAAVLDKVGLQLQLLIQQELPQAPSEALLELARRINLWGKEQPESLRIIIRDMVGRVGAKGNAHNWPLQFFVAKIQTLFIELQKLKGWPGHSFQAFLAVYLGSITYYHMQKPVLEHMMPTGDSQTEPAEQDLLRILALAINQD